MIFSLHLKDFNCIECSCCYKASLSHIGTAISPLFPLISSIRSRFCWRSTEEIIGPAILLSGVLGKVLATAMKKVFGSLKGSKDYLLIPNVDCDEKDSSEEIVGEEDIPIWAQELIPVLNLPTNVGSRIRNCVNASLGKGPPGWARERLEKSICKEIYWGNASGPTKAWSNICIAFGHKPDLVQLAETLSCNFESLDKKEVVAAYRSAKSYSRLKSPTNSLVEEIKKFVVFSNNIPEGPWEEGICKVCGIDGDDQRVLLCDACDAEYYTYCLDPPLARVLRGKWYCPKCVASNDINQPASTEKVTSSQRSNRNPEFMQFQSNLTVHLANTLAEVEYWLLCPCKVSRMEYWMLCPYKVSLISHSIYLSRSFTFYALHFL